MQNCTRKKMELIVLYVNKYVNKKMIKNIFNLNLFYIFVSQLIQRY